MVEASEDQVLTVGPLEIYVDDELARVDGRAVVISGHPFALLVALARRPGEIVGREALYHDVWGKTLQPGDRSVDVSMFRLRGALEQAGPGWLFIHTHERRGYRLAPARRNRRAVAFELPRAVPQTPEPRIIVGPAEIVPRELLVIVGGREILMRSRDMDVLALLATNAGRVLSRDAIFEMIWKRPLEPHDRSVDVAIGHLRSRLSKGAPGWEFIHTHFRRGYRFEPVARQRGRSAAPRRRERPSPRSKAPSAG